MGKRSELPASAVAMVNAALRSMGDLAFELTPDGIYLSSFGPAELMANSPEGPAGKHVTEVLPPEVAVEARAAIEGALRDGEVRAFGTSSTSSRAGAGSRRAWSRRDEAPCWP